ncbi:photosystem II reaction center protein J [Mycobacterium tuberculosis]|nr:photosystem II reaction center protein J [Mycobacterium tuberculosis]
MLQVGCLESSCGLIGIFFYGSYSGLGSSL